MWEIRASFLMKLQPVEEGAALAWTQQWELQHAKELLPAVWLLLVAPAWSSEHPSFLPISPS